MFFSQDAGRYNQTGFDASTPIPPGGTPFSAQMAGQPAKKRRGRLLLLLLIGALIIGTVLVSANLLRATTALNVQVAGQPVIPVDLNQSVPLSPYLLGSNVFPQSGTSAKDSTGQGFMSYAPSVVQGLRSAGVKLLRFPGGNWDEEHTPSTAQLNDFSSLLNQVGATGFMQVQLSDPLDPTPVPLQTRATRAALLVDYMNNPHSIQRLGANANAPFHPIKYWSVGNEPDLLTNPDTGLKYTVQEYTQAFIAYSLAMHQVDPTIQIFGPELSQYGLNGGPRDRTGALWMQGFLTGIGSYERTHNLPFQLLNGVSFHLYPFGESPSSTSALLSSSQVWTTLIPALRQVIRQTLGEDLPVAVTEINTNSGRVEPSQNLASLWWAETLGSLMSNQVEYVAFFSTEGVDSPTPLFLQKGLTPTAMLRVMQLFAQLQANLIPIQSTQGPVRVYATQDGGNNTVSLLFINTTTEAQSLSVHAESSLPIDPLNPWRSAQLSIPGYGMVVLTLQRGGSNEAFLFSNSTDAQQEVPGVQHVVCGSQTDSAFAC
jgi:hypothetical protein